jgi:hypothetical protein
MIILMGTYETSYLFNILGHVSGLSDIVGRDDNVRISRENGEHFKSEFLTKDTKTGSSPLFNSE